MKKTLSFLRALVLVLSMGTMAFADGTTTLSTTVPPATYTLNIPADQEIAFGATRAEIGNVTVSDSSGFAEGKNLKVTLSYEPFKSKDVSSTIPFIIMPLLSGGVGSLPSGSSIVFQGEESGTVTEKGGLLQTSGSYAEMTGLVLKIESTDWGKALGGDYTATITFTSEVVLAE